MKTVALLGGGDWADASVELLDIPDDMDVEKIKEEWKVWYKSEYCVRYPHKDLRVPYKTVADMMIERGAKPSNIERYDV